MRSARIRPWLLLSLLVGALPAAARPQAAPRGVPRFPIENGPLALQGPARPRVYLADLGRRAALLGDESGSFEVWTWPLKLVRDLQLAFRVPDYDEPIPAAQVARHVVARPEGASIVYSHASFTVRQHLFVPLEEPGVIILLDVETVRPLEVLVRMHADFDLAWPGSFGGGTITWLGDRSAFLLSQGGVRLYHGLIGSPFATGGTSHPAHDAPMLPSQFVLRFSPGQALQEYIPIVAVGAAAPRDSVFAAYRRLLERAPQYWEEKVQHYRRVRQELLELRSPEPRLDLALEWAKVNLDQQLVCNPDLGCGLVAGFGRAGPGNFRPGFGWYFGGDASINSFGMAGLGQFELVRQGLLFLSQYQREDGKIPHEISHAAKRLPWFTDYPYTWFHGDTTPFWILACYEYWKASGDIQLVRRLWPQIAKAFRWSAATDGDGDGLMENPRAGAGAIEVGGLGENLHTDIYLAGVWVAALAGLLELARAVDDDVVARDAAALFDHAGRSLEERYWLERPGIYAFALLAGGGAVAEGSQPAGSGLRINDALTAWPATAMSFGLLDAARARRHLREAGSSAVTTDWGARTLSRHHRLYDPLHYNNGTVWPFVTGFVALAHYRYHRAWAGYDLVRDLARMTFDFAHGRHPEVFSGALYQMLDTAVPQQFFATSMLVFPLVRGLLGLEPDAPHRALAIAPHLPAGWDSVAVDGVRVGDTRLGFSVRRAGDVLTMHVRRAGATRGAAPLGLRLAPALPLGARVSRVWVNDQDAPLRVEETGRDVHAIVEVELADEVVVAIEFRGGVDVVAPPDRVELGQPPQELRILDLRQDGVDFALLVEGLPGRAYPITLRIDGRPRRLEGAELVSAGGGRVELRVAFPAGADFTRKEIRFRM